LSWVPWRGMMGPPRISSCVRVSAWSGDTTPILRRTPGVSALRLRRWSASGRDCHLPVCPPQQPIFILAAMHVQYWPVGASSPDDLPLSLNELARHLIADWVPSLPVTLGPFFFGWPAHLIESIALNGTDHWSLHKRVRGTERQWKGVLSWMLGVVGTRHVLAREGYSYIAPLSAFYSGREEVDLSDWHPGYPPSLLHADRDPKSGARLRPDYLALRLQPGTVAVEWASVEAKGTANAIANLPTCPASWSKQARNVVVEFDGKPLQLDRNLVVATRSNPNAVRPPTRCIQVRAWNRAERAAVRPPLEAAAEVAAAQLFGLCRNVGLRGCAQSIALAARLRSMDLGRSVPAHTRGDLRELAPRAADELRKLTGVEGPLKEELPRGRMVVSTDLGDVDVEIESETVSLIRALGSAETGKAAAEVFVATEKRRYPELPDAEGRPPEVVRSKVAYGVEVRVPEQVASRMRRER
jgi:hypothetical protein